MLLNRASQYTLQALIYLARQPPGQRIMIRDIAAALGLPMFYLTKLMRAPARAGWLDAVRGRSGGVMLTVDAAGIRLADILQLTGEHPFERECLLGFKACEDASACVMHCAWQPIKQEIADDLSQHSLADLAGAWMPPTA